MNRNDELVEQFRAVLKETERVGSEDMMLYQHSRLTPLLLHARKQVPFYRTRLDAIFDGDEIDFTRWRDIPILDRETARKNQSRMRAKKLQAALGEVHRRETSGSMGRPLSFAINNLVDVANLAMTDRLYRWWGFDGAKTMINFVPPRLELPNPEKTVTHGWRSGFLNGVNILRSSGGDVDAHIDWLCKNPAEYLVSYPSLIRSLAERVAERGVDLRYERIVTRGWVVDSETWTLCEQVFGAALVDQYGANEIGQVACQCPHCKLYHVNSEGVLLELLDDSGEPVAPGSSGRVVLTSFYNYAMPFIRYEIGDVAQLAREDAVCEVTLPSIARIMGRYRNTFTLRDGRTIYPNPSMGTFRKHLPYRQIQVVQTKFDELEVRYVPTDDTDRINIAELQSWLCEELGANFTVRLLPVEEIVALPSGKYEEFISLVKR